MPASPRTGQAPDARSEASPPSPASEPRLPHLLSLSPAARSAGPAAAGSGGAGGAARPDLLPEAFVRVEQAVAFGGGERSTDAALDPLEGLPPDQVLLLESPDGTIAVSRVALLREARQWQDLRGQGADRAAAASPPAGTLFCLQFGEDALIAEARRELQQRVGDRLGGALQELGAFGVSWLATRVLLEVIEKRRGLAPGLHRWSGGAIAADALPLPADDARLVRDAGEGMLVFVHGLGGSTTVSFGDLAAGPGDVWPALTDRFGERIYGFEQHTFAASPIDNALALAGSLPDGARLHLVSHGLGGLVCDLLCLETLSEEQISRFQFRGPETGAEAGQLKAACLEQQERLRELRVLLARRQFRIERHVRVASPARGSQLLGTRLDLVLSGLLTLVETLTGLAGNPTVLVLRRLVLEIFRLRCRPDLVPGLAAMLPDSPLADLLAEATPRRDLAMATIAGECEGGHRLQSLARMLFDALFFEGCANDLVVDTASMQAGLAVTARAPWFCERASGVTHHHYFRRPASRQALVRWLCDPDPRRLADFQAMPADAAARERARNRSTDEQEDRSRSRGRQLRLGTRQPVVVVVPGLLGSHLWVRARRDRLWLDPLDLASGALARLRDIHDVRIEAEKLFDLTYGDLCRELLRTHSVVRFAYDWRQPVTVLAERLAATLRRLLNAPETADQPVRLLAHSMGGLVVRALIAREPELWKHLIGRDGARFLMLGTPNHGSHQMVETLLGKSALIRSLARFDLTMDLQQQLEVVAGFPGALQLLPRPGAEEAAAAGGPAAAQPLTLGPNGWYDPALWADLRSRNRDRWFGDGHGAIPEAALLEDGRWLWDQAAGFPAGLPGPSPDRVIFVHGQAANTPCGVTLVDGVPQMLGTAEGDGSVTWRSGVIDGIDRYYLMDADHGSLPSRRRHFPALVQLLCEGSTRLLSRVAGVPVLRAPQPVRPYQPGPAPRLSDEELLRTLVGGSPGTETASPAARPLAVSCHAMDLRHVRQPVMVGHYLQDPIAAAESLIDRAIVAGELSSRERLGLYAGPLGTATVVLMNRTQEELHRGRCRGAVVIGLGRLGDLSAATLTEAVQAGVLRYLLQIVDRHGGGQVEPVDVGLATLLLGQNSSGLISIEDSVTALVQGVLAANDQFARVFPHLSVRVGRLQIVEVFLDTAITACHALDRLAQRLNEGGPPRLEVADRLRLGRGWRHRLDAATAAGYWPRLQVLGAAEEPGSGAVPAAAGADLLRYVFLGERARAETIRQPHQRALVEALVAASISTPQFNRDLSRTLFQLLVPHPFKDLARRLDQLVLVLDACTADLPWELLLADSEPMALSMAMVRQLQSPRYRLRVRQTPARHACVIGNPITTGFTDVFVGQPVAGDTGLASLEGARAEAEAVVRVLDDYGWTIESSIEEANGIDVINRLYRHPYRILHIAAHGVFEHPSRGGERRTGVVLPDGMLITAAEIEAMEVVPDLVFLNCCHLGRVGPGEDAAGAPATPFHRLAASVARQLIEMGVRAVVACGWAVDDRAAAVFAETFYGELLRNRPFGEAVFSARKAAHAVAENSSTWGAYQAYGDPAFLLDAAHATAEEALAPPADGSEGPAWSLVSPQELIDRLQQCDLRLAETEPGQLQEAILNDLDRRLAQVPPDWLRRPPVCIALADLHAGLGGIRDDEARRLYRVALRSQGEDGGPPTRAIEQLAWLEARSAVAAGDERPIVAALRRLRSLIELCSGDEAGDAAAASPRWGLVGDLLRCQATVRARRIQRAGRAAQDRMMQALQEAIAAHARAGQDPARLLPRLLLEGVRDTGAAADADALRLAAALVEDLGREEAQEADSGCGVPAAEALLALRLLDGGLAAEGEPGEQAARAVTEAYRDGVQSLPVMQRALARALEQLRWLEDLLLARHRARAAEAPTLRACQLAAGRLAAIRAGLEGASGAVPAGGEAAAGESEGFEVLV